MDLLIYLAIFAVLMVVGSVVGSALERSHYRSIIEREHRYAPTPVSSTRHVPQPATIPATHLVMGNAVVSVDYFKQFVAGLRMMVGGRVSSYESLVDRARREALLRMREQASDMGANLVLNVRIETSSVAKGRSDRQGSIGSVEVLAYGTAVVPQANG